MQIDTRQGHSNGSMRSDARLMSCADDVDILNVDVGREHGMEIDRNRDRMALNLIGGEREFRRVEDERCIDAHGNVMRARWVENETGHFGFASRGRRRRKKSGFSIGRRTWCSALKLFR